MKRVILGHPLIQLESIDSTNLHATQLLRMGQVTEGTVILAGYQTHGRGQGKNQWVSEKGLNLLMSIILKPDFLPAMKQFYLSMSIAAGIQQYISGLGIPAMIKWPNDILTRGFKLAGILIENTVMSSCLATSVIGIGMNVNQQSFPADLPNATSLSLETGKTYDLTETLRNLISHLENSINLLYERRFSDTRTIYLNHLWKLNTRSTFTDNAGIYEGKIVDVAETGELVVMKKTGETILYEFKEVMF